MKLKTQQKQYVDAKEKLEAQLLKLKEQRESLKEEGAVHEDKIMKENHKLQVIKLFLVPTSFFQWKTIFGAFPKQFGKFDCWGFASLVTSLKCTTGTTFASAKMCASAETDLFETLFDAIH